MFKKIRIKITRIVWATAVASLLLMPSFINPMPHGSCEPAAGEVCTE